MFTTEFTKDCLILQCVEELAPIFWCWEQDPEKQRIHVYKKTGLCNIRQQVGWSTENYSVMINGREYNYSFWMNCEKIAQQT